jgi:hypothetical protein
MHARFAGSRAQLLTRTGLDWSDRYPAIAAELTGLPGSAYLDGEICAVRPDGVTSFAMLQGADAAGDGLVFFAFGNSPASIVDSTSPDVASGRSATSPALTMVGPPPAAITKRPN